MIDTSTPAGAREHARAKAAAESAKVTSKPILPISEATDLPDDLPREGLCWDETLGAGAYATRLLERGSRLRLVDVEGDACANLLVYHADRTSERLNVADTVKVQWQAYLGSGSLLLSDLGRVLMTIVRDDSEQHDTFCGASTRVSNERRYGEGANHGACPNARDRFTLALAKHDLARADIGPSIAFFKGVRVEPDGALRFLGSGAGPGACVELRAEMRCLVAVTNTPHPLDPRTDYQAGRLRLLAWTGEPTPTDDSFRNATPERRRAFENVDDYFEGRNHG